MVWFRGFSPLLPQLFAHMLSMPKPQFKPVFYCVVLQASAATACIVA